jgi:pyrroloquinoline quinone biosynthesis protein B
MRSLMMKFARPSRVLSLQSVLGVASLAGLFLLFGCSSSTPAGYANDRADGPYLVVLGTAQDAGSPQVNSPVEHPARLSPDQRRFATCLGIVDPASGRRWMIEATPDFREQAWLLSRSEPSAAAPVQIDGIFLTHAHIGHYTGLIFLGHESMGAREVPVYAAPRMSAFLSGNGPWDQLVRFNNIALRPLTPGQPLDLGGGVAITPFLVPHRQEYSEVLGFRIDGPTRSVLFIPDIDSWEQWAGMGVNLIDAVRDVDVAYLDATFYDNNEIPGRDMSSFPHPRITQTMDLLEGLALEQRGRVRFIHLNHTNPAQWRDSAARREIERRGFRVAEQGERIWL